MLTSLVLVLAATAFAGPFEDGDAAYQRGDYAAAQAILRPLAEQGDASAQNDLAIMSLYGRGVPKNEAEAVLWLRLSADQGHADAQTTLGNAYSHGLGVSRDPVESAKWHRAAADQGYAKAQQQLGVEYENGDGVAQDYVEALKWSILAVAAFPDAERRSWATINRNSQAEKMNPADIAEAEKRAQEWTPTAFRPADADLLMDAALALQRDAAMAARLFFPLAQRGLADAQTMLGSMYSVGKGVPWDSKKAVNWFRLAAQQGDACAQDNLGLARESGHGLPKDYVRAYMWHDLAAASGDRYASEFAKHRDKLASKLTPAQIAEAQALAQTCKASMFKDCD